MRCDSGLGFFPRDERTGVAFTFIEPCINQAFLSIGELTVIKPFTTIKLGETQPNLIPFCRRELGQLFKDLRFAHAQILTPSCYFRKHQQITPRRFLLKRMNGRQEP